MRLLLAGLAALCAVAFATPSFAAPKPKPGTKAYCTSLKSATARDACLKKLHASAAKTKTKTKTKKAKAKTTGKPDTAEVPRTVEIPPLPAKTI
ncbi:MAG: hypothetical protein KIT25_19755 [Enhydrobacter sp.]|nr:MAG: hypothetical protein KIT25_19755 [Enhydrobacter sp.]